MRGMKRLIKQRSNRWLVLDQSLFAMFITFSLIELTNVGAGLIDGLIVSNFLDEETGYEAALCFEELAEMTIRRGFPKCKKKPGIDLRVVYHPKELVVRMQDNCPSFNVEREIALAVDQGTTDPEEKLELRVLGGMASDIKYVHSLEMNNVILRFPL